MNSNVSPAIVRAMQAVEAAVQRAEADPARPVCHFRPPAQWMNDPNGPIWHKGYYHVFYQHNPYGDDWGIMHWGHARSRDLVHWEHLPIALWPSMELGEEHCFSGCATIRGDGQPMAFYTSIGPNKRPRDSADQWAALGDDELITWKKHRANPVLTEALHGRTKVYDWRDPFLCCHEGATYLVLGGNLNRAQGGEAVVNLYRARDASLTDWEYLGILFQHPDREIVNIECPNFFPLGDRWVLIVSPHGPVQYFVGRFNTRTCRFEPESHGLLDHSFHFYAPSSLLSPDGRRIVWGWVKDFPKGKGWNGCLSLPRVLSLSPDGRLLQTPAAEVESLKGKAGTATGTALEALAALEVGSGGEAGIRLRGCSDGREIALIRCAGGLVEVAGASAPLPPDCPSTVTLRIFMDRSVVEVFVQGGPCLTRVIDSSGAAIALERFARGNASVTSLQTWELKRIWDG